MKLNPNEESKIVEFKFQASNLIRMYVGLDLFNVCLNSLYKNLYDEFFDIKKLLKFTVRKDVHESKKIK